MDLWVVAAATGAGYVAKYWHNLSSEKDNSSELLSVSSSRGQSDALKVFEEMPDSVFPLPKLAKKWLFDGEVSSSEKENGNIKRNLHNHQNQGELSVSALAPIFVDKQVFQEKADEINGKSEYFDTFCYNKKTNSDSFSSRRPLMVKSKRDKCSNIRADNVKEYKMQRENGVFVEENKAEFFEPVGSVKLPRRPEAICSETQYHTRDSGDSQGNDMVLLFVGINIGILSTAVTTQREIEHLNKLLENAENLVQDLHYELEMKEKLIVKELAIEDFQMRKSSFDHESQKIKSQNTEIFELTSDIEAEFEAELERLEQNIILSNVLETDLVFEADMAIGDLKLDAFNQQLDEDGLSDSGENDIYENGVFTPNYVVSSLDLSLRLHEEIEAQLRARIEELEALLHKPNNSPIELNSFWDFDHHRVQSSSSTP